MNYMQDALKKKKTITVELEIDPDMGTAEIAKPMDEEAPEMEMDSKDESESNENKGMAPASEKVEEQTKAEIENDGSMTEQDISSEFNDASQGAKIGKPRSLQEALMKKAGSMRGDK